MPWFAGSDRSELRRAWCEAWRRHRHGLPLEPLQLQLAEVAAEHPEYHGLLEARLAAIEQDWSPEAGATNPFLHMGLHLAVREGLATDRPAGVRELFARLLETRGSRHEAEHVLLECLGETLWEAQRAGLPPDEQSYLARAAARTRSR